MQTPGVDICTTPVIRGHTAALKLGNGQTGTWHSYKYDISYNVPLQSQRRYEVLTLLGPSRSALAPDNVDTTEQRTERS